MHFVTIGPTVLSQLLWNQHEGTQLANETNSKEIQRERNQNMPETASIGAPLNDQQEQILNLKVTKNSKDLWSFKQLFAFLLPEIQKSKAVFLFHHKKHHRTSFEIEVFTRKVARCPKKSKRNNPFQHKNTFSYSKLSKNQKGDVQEI